MVEVSGVSRDDLQHWRRAGFISAALQTIGKKPVFLYPAAELPKIRRLAELTGEGYSPKKAFEKWQAEQGTTEKPIASDATSFKRRFDKYLGIKVAELLHRFYKMSIDEQLSVHYISTALVAERLRQSGDEVKMAEFLEDMDRIEEMIKAGEKKKALELLKSVTI